MGITSDGGLQQIIRAVQMGITSDGVSKKIFIRAVQMGITSDGGLQTNIYSSSTNGDNLRRGSPKIHLFEQYKWG
jgi:hypothetical protein